MNKQTMFSLYVGAAMGVTFLNLPPVLQNMMGLYGISYGGVSFLLSALLWSHAAIQAPGGMVVDRLSPRAGILLCVGLMAIGNLLPSLALNLSLAMTGRVVTGFGTGLAFVIILKLLATHSPPHLVGTHQGFFGGAFSLGSIAAYVYIPDLFALDWRWPFWSAGLLSAVAVAWALLLPLKPVESGKLKPLPMRRLMALKIGWIIGLYHAISYGSMINLGNWIPSVLAEASGTPVSQLAWGGSLILLVSGLGRIGGGAILARVRASTLANGSIALLAVLYFSLFLASPAWLVLTLALTASWFASITFGAFFQIAGKGVEARSLGSLFGFVNLVANLGAILFTLAFGLFKDHAGSFAWGFALMSAMAALALALGHRTVLEMTREEII